MKKLVLSIAIGDAWEHLAEVTHPTQKAYAERIGAQFACINGVQNGWGPHWTKCAIYDLLGREWDRIIYLDSDCLVRPDCPDLFEIVPDRYLGALNEGFLLPRNEAMQDAIRLYCDNNVYWDGCYYNTGVMVISRKHRHMFHAPATQPREHFYEQSYLNVARIISGVEMHDIRYCHNFMPSFQELTGMPMQSGYIAHLAGVHAGVAREQAKAILHDWETKAGDYSYQRRVWLDFGGGLGDVIDAEPVLRYAQERTFPGADIRVTTPWPRVFDGKGVSVGYGPGSPFGDIPAVKLAAIPEQYGQGVLSVLTHVSSNATDFASIGMLHQQLPLDRKRAQLHVTDEDVAEVDALAGEFALDKSVLIHPGRTWDSRTFPVEWWQAVIDGIAAESPVALMGLNGEIHGVLPVECPGNGLDLRDRTSMGAMFELVRRCPCLVTNDSSPVHVAGAFDNWIVLIPSARQPDFVLPWRRNKTPYWRADALYKRLTIDDVECSPVDYYGTHANGFDGDWADYLPDAQEVITAALRGRAEVLADGREQSKLCVAGGDASLGGGEAGVEPGNGHKRNGRGGSGRRAKAPALPGKA